MPVPDDFADRFAALFQRLQEHWYPKGRIEVHVLEGRDPPIHHGGGEINLAPGSPEPTSWTRKTCVVVTFWYPPDYPQEQRDMDCSGWIPKECAAILLGLGLGPLLHTGTTLPDRFLIYAWATPSVYARLPPLGETVRVTEE
jgi:hypothetical protein